MAKLKLGFAAVALLGLALYLWGALAAPVVLWSDSQIDMSWARSGAGIWRPIPAPSPGEPLVHPPKIGYLLFLAAAMRAVPAMGEARSVVAVQSLLLWASIVGTSWLVGRRHRDSSGLAACLAMLLLFRIRDSASAVMSEAICAALFLPLAALVIWSPRRLAGLAAAGAGAAVLFTIRPDVGAMLFVLMLAASILGRNWRALGAYAGTFAALTLAVWAATHSVAGSDPLRGIGHPILEGSADYYWRPSLGDWPRARTQTEMGRQELEQAATNWRRTLWRHGPDARRELIWRAFHGFLGTEFYDARWSPRYRFLDEASRLLTPFLLLAAVAALALPLTPAGTRSVGWALLLCVVGHNLLFGSNPRYLLPVLPLFALLLVLGIRTIRELTRQRQIAAVVFFAILVLAARFSRQVLDWQWGMVESAGVTLRQPIARGSLPPPPSMLHLRTAAPQLPTGAGLIVRTPDGRLLYSSLEDTRRQRPDIAITIPAWLAAVNSTAPTVIEISSFGSFDAYHFLLFPVVPPPWGKSATRIGSSELSPASGLHTGSLDWWAHRGSD